jgi:catechol 2,3-dioxygenase-like lactoylglutathione lyase family enzyme
MHRVQSRLVYSAGITEQEKRMTSPDTKMYAYHLGIVVHDLEAACSRYSELLGVPAWHRSQVERPGVPVNPNTAGGRGTLNIAFGRVPGMTFELIHPEGAIEHRVFLDSRGEGLQHIGIWTPDVQAAVRDAVAKGCKVTHAALNQEVATISLTPQSPPGEIVPFLGNLAYVDPGIGGFQLEFVGTVNPGRHRDMFEEITDEVIPLPPWCESR